VNGQSRPATAQTVNGRVLSTVAVPVAVGATATVTVPG